MDESGSARISMGPLREMDNQAGRLRAALGKKFEKWIFPPVSEGSKEIVVLGQPVLDVPHSKLLINTARNATMEIIMGTQECCPKLVLSFFPRLLQKSSEKPYVLNVC